MRVANASFVATLQRNAWNFHKIKEFIANIKFSLRM